MIKRAIDIALVVIAAPVWVPLLCAIALVLVIGDGSPVLFKQVRPGRGGKPFQIMKFRTMSAARDKSGELLPDAARLSRIGRFLRSTSLDELPELWNVLAGEMSLVGPRPLLMDYLPLYTPDQARRHDVRPGITGLAQVNGRNTIQWEDKFALDIWYVDHHSLWLDFRILAKTLASVVRREGIAAPHEATMPRFLGTGRSAGGGPSAKT